MKNYLKIIEINEYSKTPKYLQIFDSILNAIKNKLVLRAFAVVKNERDYVDNFKKIAC